VAPSIALQPAITQCLVNDLGEVIDSRLTFHTHIGKHFVHASVRANLIQKCFISHDVLTQIRAFIVYVRHIYLIMPRVYMVSSPHS